MSSTGGQARSRFLGVEPNMPCSQRVEKKMHKSMVAPCSMFRVYGINLDAS